MKPARIAPPVAGYEKPFTLSFKGHLATGSAEDRSVLLGYVGVFRESAIRLINLLCSMEQAGGDERLMAYLLISPSVIPDDIDAHPAWVAEVTRDEATAKAWKKLHSYSLFHFLRGVAVPDARATSGSEGMKAVFARYGLSSRIASAEAFNDVFGRIDSDIVCAQLGDVVSGAVKAFFSARNNSLKLSRERQAAVERLRLSDGAFFIPLERMFQKDAAWTSATRHFMELRKALKAEGVPPDVVSACQWRAVLKRPEIKPWQPMDRPDEEFLEIAELNPEILARFEALIPPGFTAKDAEPHRFRHLMKDTVDADALAKEPHLVARLLALYQAAYGKFTPEQLAALAHNGGREHQGWKAIAKLGKEWAKAKGKAKAALDAASVEFYTFVSGPVREFCSAMRPVSIPAAPKVVDVWPLLANNMYGWEVAASPAGSPSNMMHVTLFIPRHLRADGTNVSATRIEVSVRGNLPGANATMLAAPMDIANGTSQLRPDRYIAMPGDPTRRILLKHQAMRLTVEESGAQRIFGSFASTLLAEMPAATKPVAKAAFEERSAIKDAGGKVDASLYRRVGTGERLAVVHVGPGGMRVATLTIFQRVVADKSNPTGWVQIPFRHSIRRTDRNAIVLENGKKRVVLNAVERTDMVLHLHASHYDRMLQEQEASLGNGHIMPSANELNMKLIGEFRTNTGRTFYRQLAAVLARTCARNGVGRVLIGGGGMGIRGLSGYQHPLRDFYTLAMNKPAGYLVNALQKAGVSINSVSAQAGTLLTRGWRTGASRDLPRGIVFHDETVRTDDTLVHKAVQRGRRNLIVNPARITAGEDWLRAAECYATNAAWAILLKFCDKDFDKAASRALEIEPAEMPALPDIVERSALPV